MIVLYTHKAIQHRMLKLVSNVFVRIEISFKYTNSIFLKNKRI